MVVPQHLSCIEKLMSTCYKYHLIFHPTKGLIFELNPIFVSLIKCKYCEKDLFKQFQVIHE